MPDRARRSSWPKRSATPPSRQANRERPWPPRCCFMLIALARLFLDRRLIRNWQRLLRAFRRRRRLDVEADPAQLAALWVDDQNGPVAQVRCVDRLARVDLSWPVVELERDREEVVAPLPPYMLDHVAWLVPLDRGQERERFH